MPLYWNEQGSVNCEKHIPYRGSDTWVFEHWKEITPNQRIEIASMGGRVANHS